MEFKKLNEIERLVLKWKDFDKYVDYKFWLRVSNAPRAIIEHEFKAITSFKHSGNSGDIIYSLPAIYALSIKGKAHLYLNPHQPILNKKLKKHPLGAVMLNNKVIDMLRPLMLHQPQIGVCDVLANQPIDYDLDIFRHQPFHLDKGSISRWYFHAFGIYANLSEPWLTAPKDESYSEHLVIARSNRYRSPGINYSFLKRYSKKIFVGVIEEYDEMKTVIPQLEYRPVKDFLELASVINGCRLFIGNQSFPFSLAEALKVNRLLEVFYKAPNVIVEGKGGHDFYFQEHFEKAVRMLYD